MKKGLRQVIVSTVLLGSCAGIAIGLAGMSKPPEKEEEPDNALSVRSGLLTPESVSFSIQSQGTVRPAVETAMVAEVSGVVTWISPVFASGGLFDKNDILATIDDSDYKVALIQAEASLAASQARLQEERARSEAEEQIWVRSGKKLADAPALLLRKPYIKEAQASIKAAEAQLAKARRDLERTQIKAPYSGMVRERTINPGQFVSRGTGVGSIFSVTNAEIRLPFKASDLALFKFPRPGEAFDNDLTIELSQSIGGQTISWSASLSRVEGVVSEQSRMHYVIATVADPYGLADNAATDEQNLPALKMGSFVQASLQAAPMDQLFSLPRGVIYGDGKILLIDENNTLRFQKILPLHANGDNIYFRFPPAADINTGGTKVSLTPLSNPIEGTEVKALPSQNAEEVAGEPVTVNTAEAGQQETEAVL
ncbi:efflux RND transporter periplasmic adaptor subunit [Parendozoicomonas haliclonae]|nr:efflux RND transporter periplasmic adaptor subunit [Parendozoicomonas haliclonae]